MNRLATHDATPTWSGYNYQGKVALYLLLFNSEEKSVDELKKHKLILENIEDVQINREEEIISVHQVKAYESSTRLSSYSDAIWLLVDRVKSPLIQKGYLHTSKSIPALTELNLSRLNISLSLTQQGKTKPIGDEMKAILDKLSLYQYSDLRGFCDLENIEVLIKQSISKILITNNQEHKNNPDCIEKIYLFLLGFMDRHIIKRHRSYATFSIDNKEISFFELIDQILTFDFDQPTEKYVFYRLKNEFLKIYDKFYANEVNNGNGTVNLNQFMRFIESTEEEFDFAKFCRYISPHCILDPEDHLNNFRILIPSTGLNHYFGMIAEINENCLHVESKILYVKDAVVYLPSTIFITDPRHEKETVRDIARDILTNSLFLTALYEVDKVISYDVEVESIQRVAENITYLSSEERITDIKDISIIKADDAKNTLN